MRFPDSFLDEIRDRVPISSVIGQRVAWDRKKTNASRGDYWACCPFHGEKSPSFHCEDRKGRYHCFGCSVSGDHFKFLTELDGISFPEAVEKIADMAGLPMPARDPESEKREKQRATLHDVMELATRFFQEQLQAASGAKARAYLRDRGLTSVTIQKFRLGYAPDNRNALKEYLAGKGVEKSQLEACGLVVFGDDVPVSYDRFRDRIIFPIEDTRGRVVAFGGRALSSEVSAKYLNSPETELFHKGNLLYNFARARNSVNNGGAVVVVEGYMDVISLAQAGVDNAVAPLGTALTENQLELLWKISPEPIMCFDGDAAGSRAALRAIDVCFPKLKSGYSLKFAALPDGKDPDDLIKSDGRDAFYKHLGSAIPLHEFFILRRRQMGPDISPEQMAKAETDLYADVDKIGDPTVKRYYRSHLRLRLYEMFGRTHRPPADVNVRARLSLDKLGINRLQRILLGLCVEFPGLLTDYVEQLTEFEFSNSEFQLFAKELHRLYVEYSDLTVAAVYERIDKRFMFVLEAIHGSEKVIKTRENRHGTFYEYQVTRGHKLRSLFPMLRFEPPYETIKQTLEHLFLEIEARQFRDHCLSVAHELDQAGFESMQRQLDAIEATRAESELELDQEYQALAGRHQFMAA